MSLFYRSTIESIITFCISSWGGNVRCQEKTKFDRLIKKAGKIARSDFPSFDAAYAIHCFRKIERISSDIQHPLAPQIKYSPRSNRILLIHCKTERFRKSFLPSAVKLICHSTATRRTQNYGKHDYVITSTCIIIMSL